MAKNVACLDKKSKSNVTNIGLFSLDYVIYGIKGKILDLKCFILA